MGAGLGKKIGQIFKPLDQDHKSNFGNRDYLFISILGVAQEHQGKGHEGRLLRTFIDKSNRAGIPLYLETETEENVRYYEGFGFKVLKKITLPIVDHPMWEMIREPEEVK